MNERRFNAADQRAELDFIQSLNREKRERGSFHPEVEGVIQSYELAFRMQREMPEVIDLSGETAVTQKACGLGSKKTDDMGRKCLLARRMIEAGVRFVEITHGNRAHHFSLNARAQESCDEVNQPIAALLADPAQRDDVGDSGFGPRAADFPSCGSRFQTERREGQCDQGNHLAGTTGTTCLNRRASPGK